MLIDLITIPILSSSPCGFQGLVSTAGSNDISDSFWSDGMEPHTSSRIREIASSGVSSQARCANAAVLYVVRSTHGATVVNRSLGSTYPGFRCVPTSTPLLKLKLQPLQNAKRTVISYDRSS